MYRYLGRTLWGPWAGGMEHRLALAELDLWRYRVHTLDLERDQWLA